MKLSRKCILIIAVCSDGNVVLIDTSVRKSRTGLQYNNLLKTKLLDVNGQCFNFPGISQLLCIFVAFPKCFRL